METNGVERDAKCNSNALAIDVSGLGTVWRSQCGAPRWTHSGTGFWGMVGIQACGPWHHPPLQQGKPDCIFFNYNFDHPGLSSFPHLCGLSFEMVIYTSLVQSTGSSFITKGSTPSPLCLSIGVGLSTSPGVIPRCGLTPGVIPQVSCAKTQGVWENAGHCKQFCCKLLLGTKSL